MERIGALIQRMLEQYNSNADSNSLILTAQMLLNELQENNNGSTVAGKKVTVILPSIKKIEVSEQAIKQQEDNFEKNLHLKTLKKEYLMKKRSPLLLRNLYQQKRNSGITLKIFQLLHINRKKQRS